MKIQGDNNSFIEFLKEKSEIDFGDKVVAKEAIQEEAPKEIISLEKTLKENMKEDKKEVGDIEVALVSDNQKVINSIRFDFFKDFAEKTMDFKFFGRFISSRIFVPSLAVFCLFILLFSIWIGVLRDKGYTYAAFLNKVSEFRSYEELETDNERQQMEDFILNNTTGRVAGVEASIEDEEEEVKENSKLIQSLSSLAEKQVELSKIMNDKLIKVLEKK